MTKKIKLNFEKCKNCNKNLVFVRNDYGSCKECLPFCEQPLLGAMYKGNLTKNEISNYGKPIIEDILKQVFNKGQIKNLWIKVYLMSKMYPI
jgi:hypothetical protein